MGTGRHQRFERPEAEWQIEHRPDLRIVADNVRQRVRARIDAPRANGASQGRGRGARTLFGGLLKCGHCGGAMVAVNARLYGCSVIHDRGDYVCRGTYTLRHETDMRLLSRLRDELLSPTGLAEFRRVAQIVLREASSDQVAGKAVHARLQELDKEINRLVDAIASMGVSDALRTRLQAAESEWVRLQQAEVQVASPKLRLADVVKRFEARMMDMRKVLDGDIELARSAIKEALGPISVVEDDSGVWAELEATPAVMLRAAGVVYKSGSGGQI